MGLSATRTVFDYEGVLRYGSRVRARGLQREIGSKQKESVNVEERRLFRTTSYSARLLRSRIRENPRTPKTIGKKAIVRASPHSNRDEVRIEVRSRTVRLLPAE